MPQTHYLYEFREDTSIDEVCDLLFLAAMAVESLHGRSSLRLDGTFLLERATRRCNVTAGTEVGRDLARIFTGYLGRLLGENSFKVSLALTKDDAAAEEGGAA